jgi:hypothetical protein
VPVATTHDLTWGSTTVTKRYSRWSRGEPRREWQALQLLHSRVPDLVPEPLECDLGQTAPFVTMSRLPGTPIGADLDITPACLDATAEALRTLHDAVPPAELSELSERWWAAETGIIEIRGWADAEQSRDDLSTLAGPVQEALGAGVRWVHGLPAELATPTRPVFARADGNAANLLWDGERVRIVDFEDAGVSDLAYEVADTVEHLSVWSDAGIEADDLLGRLALTSSEQSRVAEYRRLFALFWLLMLLPGNPAHHRNPPGTLDGQADRLLRLL